MSEVGARLRLAAARAVVRKVGYRKARRGPTHAHPPSVWRGTAAFVAECARGEGEPSPA
ncbi:MAG TPA: hypothetical protein VNO79_13950 [Actinomycetota bacterium]|nr:hypothetical protein [Actinomycetota bacterium]